MEVLADPHLHERGFLTVCPTESGTVALPNSPMRYEGSGLRTLTSPPSIGEHTDAVLTRALWDWRRRAGRVAPRGRYRRS